MGKDKCEHPTTVNYAVYYQCGMVFSKSHVKRVIYRKETSGGLDGGRKSRDTIKWFCPGCYPGFDLKVVYGVAKTYYKFVSAHQVLVSPDDVKDF